MRRHSLVGGRLRRLVVLPLLGAILLAGASMTTTARPTRAGSFPKYLDKHLGVVLDHPQIYNLYFDESWDADNPPGFGEAAIDDFTTKLIGSGYFAPAQQYGVNTPTFAGSHGAHTCVPPVFSHTVTFPEMLLWLACETAIGPDPFILPTLTGVAVPSANTLYVVYLPKGMNFSDELAQSCSQFLSVHLAGVTEAWQYPTVLGAPLPPVVGLQQFAFEVVPIECATADPPPLSSPSYPYNFDDLTLSASHEMIEAATDPFVGTGWDDTSLGSINSDLSYGEAADICNGLNSHALAPSPSILLPDGLTVAPYWSNAEGTCVPHVFTLTQFGIPPALNPTATWNGQTVALPYSVIVDAKTTYGYTFPSPVSDPNPGIRYVTTLTSGTVNLAQSDVLGVEAEYKTQYFLTTQASPAAIAAGDASLTPSDWQARSSTATVTTDPIITTSTGSRYQFRGWSGDIHATATTAKVIMTGPKTVTANYGLQHLVTVNTSGLGANNTLITNGPATLGTANDTAPLAVWVDDGPFALGASANVSGADGTQYFFQGFAPAPPTTLAAPFTTTATYKTMAQLINEALASGGLTGPGATGLGIALKQQFAAVQLDVGGHSYDQALVDLESFISHVQAQCCVPGSGQHLTTSTAQTLQLDAMLVYHNALCLALAMGQIDSVMAAFDYGVYSGLVTSLGGIVLPPC